MTDMRDVEVQLRTLLRDAYDGMEYAPDFEDKLLQAADRVDQPRRPVWPRIGAGLLAAALVAAVAIAAVVASHGRPRPASPTPSAPNIRMLNLGVAPGAGLTIVTTSSGYGGNARHLFQALEVSGSQGTYEVDALQPGDRLHTVFRLPALASAQRVDIAGNRGFYFACVPPGATCQPLLAWLYRPHAWAVVTASDGANTESALRNVATAIRLTETPMRTAVAVPYAPQHLRPTLIFAQYAHYQGATGGLRSTVGYGEQRDGGTVDVQIRVSRGSLSANQRTGTPVTVGGHRAYLTRSHGMLTLDFAPAPEQVAEVTADSWTKSGLVSFASHLRFAANLADVHTWFDARSAVP